MSLDELQQKDIDHLNENINKLEKVMHKGFNDIEKQLTLMGNTFVRKEIFDLLIDRVEKLESFNRWFIRSVVGGVLGALLVSLITLII